MARRLTSIATLALALLPACGPTGGPDSFLGRTLDDVAASQQLAFRADRRYADHIGTSPVTWVERYHRNESGFRLELLELDGKTPDQMTATEAEEFDRLQQLLEGGRGRYVAKMRDFEVRDQELFLANYSWTVFDTPAAVAGRAALVAEVMPNRLDRPWYRLWIDQENLVTLRYEEYLPSGVLAAEMEVLSIEFLPDLTGLSLRPLKRPDPQEILPAQIGSFVAFEAFLPAYLPEGFVLTSCRLTSLAGSNMLALTYEDGVQELLIVEYQQLEPEEVLEGTPVTVRMEAFGPTIDADLGLLGTQLHLTSKVAEGEIMGVVEGLETLKP